MTIVGVTHETVAQDLAPVRNLTPEVHGLDGKTYSPKPDVIRVNAHTGHWPAWTETETRTRRADRPLRGWRMWSVLDTGNGPRLCPQFVHGENVNLEELAWAPGRNTSSTIGCPQRDHGAHPLIDCRCGLRVMQSLTALRAFADYEEQRFGPIIAWAQVDIH